MRVGPHACCEDDIVGGVADATEASPSTAG
jgi:hypothetical protein